MHNFKKSLKKGQDAEAEFLLKYPNLVRTDGRKHDYLNSKGEKVELKSDSYSLDQTENFFMEIVSVKEKLKIGGPFQSLSNGVDYYVYQFASDNAVFIFKTSELCAKLLLIADVRKQRDVLNKDYKTTGILIKRTDLTELLISDEVLK